MGVDLGLKENICLATMQIQGSNLGLGLRGPSEREEQVESYIGWRGRGALYCGTGGVFLSAGHNG